MNLKSTLEPNLVTNLQKLAPKLVKKWNHLIRISKQHNKKKPSIDINNKKWT